MSGDALCPNCEQEHAGLYVSETGVRHCGCYHDEPVEARHTFSRDTSIIEVAVQRALSERAEKDREDWAAIERVFAERRARVKP